MADVIVFDLYGVIACEQSELDRRRIVELAGVPAGPFWEAYWACRPAYDAGQPSEDYWRAVGGVLGRRFGDIAALISADLESWCRVDQEMVALVTELADQGRTLGLLSNIIDDLVPIFERLHGGWLARFAALTYSCRIGVAKPDPRAYEICAEQLGVRPADAFFIDDRESNVLAAREVGMRAEVFSSPQQVRELLAA